jgi:hypothetical protein
MQEQYHKNLTLIEAETMAITILKQVMEEKLDASNVEVACVKMPPAEPEAPLTAACHYVPLSTFKPQFSVYKGKQLEEALARVTAAAS